MYFMRGKYLLHPFYPFEMFPKVKSPNHSDIKAYELLILLVLLRQHVYRLSFLLSRYIDECPKAHPASLIDISSMCLRKKAWVLY